MASKNFVNLAVNNLNQSIEKSGNPVPRVRSLEGREAGIVATAIQGLFRLMLGRALNPIEVQAHSSRIMLSSFLSNAILGSGRMEGGEGPGASGSNTNCGTQWVPVLNGHQRRGRRQGRPIARKDRSCPWHQGMERAPGARALGPGVCRQVSATPVDVPDEFFASLRTVFSEREIVELTGHIAHENYNAKSNRPLRVEANNFCEIPLPGRRV
jgi:hypothetical protein